jgi:DNA-binding CsgD family transcriptional regulator
VHEITGADADPGAVLEILARADYLDLALDRAIEGWERAYAAYRTSGDTGSAIRIARTLAGMYHSVLGQFAVSSGWMARAQTLLEGGDHGGERGWVLLNLGMFEPHRDLKNDRLREALAEARAADDVALEVAALGYLGASLVHSGETSEGMRLLDEALAALAGDEVDDFFVVEEVFCQLFSACEHARDVARAEEWISVGEALAQRRNLPAVSAFCRTHYGGVLTAAGRWGEADQALTDAVRLWGLGGRSSVLRGGALVRLAELRVRQGRYEEAAELLADADPAAAAEAARPRAAIHVARGEHEAARDLLEGTLEDAAPDSPDTAAMLELLVEVLLVLGDTDQARQRHEQLDRAAGVVRSPYVRALAALARGHVCLATHTGDPRARLREALKWFTHAQVPLETALTRLHLARVLATDRPTAAITEARAALETFDRLKATRYADAAAALLRSLGAGRAGAARAADAGVLTRREAEVLDLLGRGLSNPEIAERLYISRKTVEHHVSNVLAKLHLRSRAEAAAYAVRRAPEPAAE